MKNKFLLFPAISSVCYYHTDRPVTFLPATREANEKSPEWKMQYQTCDLFRGYQKHQTRLDLWFIEIGYIADVHKKHQMFPQKIIIITFSANELLQLEKSHWHKHHTRFCVYLLKHTLLFAPSLCA